MKHVAKAESGCWLWTAYRMKNGYGNFRTPARHELAHRSSYRLFVGPLDQRDVMHKCDNPSCVNPEHLSLGTRRENMRDASNKGRMRIGEAHGRAKLSVEQATYALTAPGLQKEIAAALGVTQSHISAIRTGKVWGAVLKENHHR